MSGSLLRRLAPLTLLVALTTACPESEPPPPDTETQVRRLCSVCHVFPEPHILPRHIWASEVSRMFELLQQGTVPLSSDLDPGVVTRFFEERAPLWLKLPQGLQARSNEPFRRTEWSIAGVAAGAPQAISQIELVRLLDAEREDLLVCDMFGGSITTQRLDREEHVVIGTVSNPAHAEVVDLDGDGLRDLVVASLGSFFPRDHEQGSVVWLRNEGDGAFSSHVLLDGVGRVADVQAADLDEDGDLDLAVAEFGWIRTGGVHWLENRTEEGGPPTFQQHTLDARPGAVHVPIVDLDGDGRLDIVVVLAQQFETVIAYLGKGGDRFDPQIVYQAPYPDWGSNGIEVVDLEADGDLDILLVNGDVFDAAVVREAHGIHLLENRGTYPFEPRQLVHLPGAMALRTGDLDDDGDLDVAAVAMLPPDLGNARPIPSRDTIVWLEQTAPGTFAGHSLERDDPTHAAVHIGDIDADGKLEILFGSFNPMGIREGRPAVRAYAR